MPRRKKKKEEEDSDSDYKEGGEISKEENVEKRAKRGKPKNKPEKDDDKIVPLNSTKRQKKRKRKSYEVTEADNLPSYARKTAKGGYSHTNRSKSLISKANSGNTPWNKGKFRSSADKAKIAAGVRARNRAILLEKLKRLGMSEEEYNQKKKEIKYLRERIRRSKLANEKHKAVEAEHKLKAVLDATSDKVVSANTSSQTVAADRLGTKDDSKEESKDDNTEEDPENQPGDEVFARDIVWTTFSFGDEGESYDQLCPEGGPGGLICCEFCSKKYSDYLGRTVDDIEIQRTHKVGNEAKEVLKFLADGRKTLDRAVGIARRKVPPLPPLLPIEPTKQQTRRTSASRQDSEPAEWNLTSTIDIGLTGQMESV